MSRPVKGPDEATLRMYVEQGKTVPEMVEAWKKHPKGDVMSTSGMQARLRRFGLTKTKKRLNEPLPWTVKTEHSRTHVNAMLTALRKRRAGLPLRPDDEGRLNSFLRGLDDRQTVIGYSRHLGFREIYRDTVPPELIHPDMPIMLKTLDSL